MKRAALDFAALGWRCFPVGADGRTPLVKAEQPGSGGCHAASDDPAQVERWWTRWPSANIALACGPRSGVLALDIDHKGAVDGFAALAELEREFSPLPATVQSRTPSGGAHVLFAYPANVHPANRVGLKRFAPDGSRKVYAGLDVRGRGGSICLPPSRKGSGCYEWARDPFAADLAPVPDWLLALMLSEPPPREPVKLSARRDQPERLSRYVCSAVNGECREVAAMAPGSGRNHRLFLASARLGELVGAGALLQDEAEAALERAATECGLVGEDGLRSVRLTIASGIRRGVQNPRELAA